VSSCLLLQILNDGLGVGQHLDPGLEFRGCFAFMPLMDIHAIADQHHYQADDQQK